MAVNFKVDLQNCYGIGEFKHTFDLFQTNICLIYA